MSEVLWREWGNDAFEEARKADKPILLDIGAVWCHWCHVMDHGIPGDSVHTGTYSNPDIIEAINSQFIPIKVDNDRRPDVNARYNMGGWPTTAFLTPTGDPMYGATYITPQQMLGLLDSISQYYSEHKDAINSKSAEYAEKQISSAESVRSVDELSEEIIEFVVGEIKQNFEPKYGGFGFSPKFPHPGPLTFAAQRFVATGDRELHNIVEKTLVEMSSGGTYDQFAGGYFRYSTNVNWSIPHYEKMLEDNCRLLVTNLIAYQALKDDRFRDIARDVQRFMMDVLFDPKTGAFAGSQDADQEELYYGRPLSERESMPTPYIDWTVYLDWNALSVTAFCKLYQVLSDTGALQTAIRLYDFLTQNVAPCHYYRDGKSAGTRNQLCDIESLLGASIDLFESTGSARYLGDARGLADIAITELFNETAQRFSDIPEEPNQLGSLNIPHFDIDDNAQFAEKLIRLSTLTGITRYRTVAEVTLKALAGEYRQHSYFGASFASAVSRFLGPTVLIVIIGDLESAEMERLKAVAYNTFVSGKVVSLRSPEDYGEYLPDPENRPIAYVCRGTVCFAPTVEPAKLASLMEQAHRE